MKKFTRILICLLLCVFGVGLVACDNRTPKEKAFVYPSAADDTLGNGGMAVKKGDYLYFVNGYANIDEQENRNKSYTIGALLVVKLDAAGKMIVDENNLLQDEYYVSMSNRLCGYQATNLYIHGSYLYFVTPSLDDEPSINVGDGNKDNWAKDRVELYRIKLDKKGGAERVWQSNVGYNELDFEYYEVGNSLYVLAHESGKSKDNADTDTLILVNATAKTFSNISTNVSSVVFADNSDEIFFVYDKTTGSGDDKETEYILKQYSISNGFIDEEFHKSSNSFKVEFAGNDKVYYSQTTKVGDNTYTDMYMSPIANKNISANAFRTNVKDFKFSPDGDLLMVSSNKVFMVKDNNSSNDVVITDADTTKITIIGFENGCAVYYDADKNIKMFSYTNAKAGDIKITTIAEKVEDLNTEYFDLQEDYLYFYKKAGQNKNEYLHRVKVGENKTVEMFGLYQTGDAPEVESDDEQ